MKKSAFALSTLCLTLSLTACGGSGDNTASNPNNPTNPTNPTNPNTPTNPTNPTNNNAPIQNGVLNYTVFDIYRDSANKSAWGSLEYTLGNGFMREVLTTVTGASPYTLEHDNQDIDVRVGKGFISIVPESQYEQLLGKTVKIVDGDTLSVTYPNTQLTEILDISSFDISGKGRNTTNLTSGVITDLDHYNSYFKAINYSFPQGSQCYVFNTKTNLPSYYLDHSADSSAKDLGEWVSQQQYNHYIENNGKREVIKASDIVYENVGKNNDLPAVHFKDQVGNYHSAILYEGSVVTADYTDGVNYEMPVANTDPAKGPIECWAYNKVAADYLAEQMKASYGK